MDCTLGTPTWALYCVVTDDPYRNKTALLPAINLAIDIDLNLLLIG